MQYATENQLHPHWPFDRQQRNGDAIVQLFVQLLGLHEPPPVPEEPPVPVVDSQPLAVFRYPELQT